MCAARAMSAALAVAGVATPNPMTAVSRAAGLRSANGFFMAKCGGVWVECGWTEPARLTLPRPCLFTI